ncbi:unnamed protein product [Rotaria sp. Silwood2]|nr:unnamed protein product [Rotaria sp. Silwood2]CAF2750439.1 unnamed protein product [Rotaria sp. Silwood2]CAF3018207.1 unnamed protein product [Rotaria sp. Silwood2]CAF3183684.1 unnamed protein product [Rotaria sp. Silwood2]CAF3887920.1 unnamed protein product [Rotaria sp. Silwood2]
MIIIVALEYCQKALSIQQVSLPLNHPDKAFVYGLMVKIYWDKNDNKRSLQILDKCLAIQLSSQCLNNHSIRQTYHDIVVLYTRIKDYTAGL